MKPEDLLNDDEALDRALAELGQTRMPRKRSARLSRVALGAAGLVGISSGLPAWAIGALVTGGLSAGAGTVYLAATVIEEQSSSQAGVGENPRPGVGTGKVREPAAVTGGRGGVGGELKGDDSPGTSTSAPEPGPAGEVEHSHPFPGNAGAHLPQPLLLEDRKPSSPGLVPRQPGASERGVVSSEPQAIEATVDRGRLSDARGQYSASLLRPPARTGAPLTASRQASASRTRAPETASKDTSSRAAVVLPADASATNAPAQPAEVTVAAASSAPPRVDAPVSAPPAATPASAADVAPTAPALIAPMRDSLELELGALSPKPGTDSQVLGGGPAVHLAWRHGSSERGFRGWTRVAGSAGPREGLDPQALRWGYGLDVGAGLGLSTDHWRLDGGWSLGGRWIPATADALSPEDLVNAGWLFLVTGPELELRLGPPDRWGVVLRVNAEATYLNEAEAMTAAPLLRIGYGGWIGVALPFGLP